MDLQFARTLLDSIPATARVVDVGGGASPFPRADYVLDARSFDERPIHRAMRLDAPNRFTRDTWVQVDLCDHRPWPFPDKFFDFATCSHLLEDVRDPIWICSELRRVAKAGYIETPSRVLEQSLGVESPDYAGYCHHRWLVSAANNTLEFRFKPHLLHADDGAIVTRLAPNRMINPRHAIVSFRWNDSFEFREVLEFDEQKVVEELRGVARQARALPDLTVPSDRKKRPLVSRLRSQIAVRRRLSGLRKLLMPVN